MREDLLSDSDGLRITRVRSDVPCVWSGGRILESHHALAVRMHNLSDRTRIAWCSIPALNEIGDCFERFDSATHAPKHELSQTGDVKYNTVRGSRQTCAVCQSHIPQGSDAISFYQRRYNTFEDPKTSWVHCGCLDQFVTAIENAWEYADILLPQEV